MGDITQDLLKCIALLSSLGDFPHLRSMITRDLSAATKSNPFTSTQLRTYLDGEQTLMNSDTKTIPESIVLTAQTKPPLVVCSNCKRNGHIMTYCISSGGGMEGKSIEESKQARRQHRDAKKLKGTGSAPSSKGKVSVKVQGSDGHVYIMQVNSDDLVATPVPATENFAGIAEFSSLPLHNVESSITANSPDNDIIEYDGFFAMEEITTSVDWNNNSCQPDSILNVSDINPLSQHSSTDVGQELPFWMDTGASIHISPERKDFITLRAIQPRAVKGLGGSSIMALGLGNIKLRVGRGAHLILKDVLYIPHAEEMLTEQKS
ncbi:hypothetical protein M422DRAFT_242219 [Sphaerobolus stellatus SS14]|nr:hypothetical protein M422DRAFT_242219 [Sphaerobolus stellatus SS14]